MTSKNNLFITGRPGVGKTTLIRRLAERLSGYPLAGFWTEEIRQNGSRVGFRIATWDGRSGILAHRDLKSRFRVGKYGVDVSSLDAVVRHLQQRPEQPNTIYLIDEIGKMESFSALFRQWIESLLESPGLVVATISLASHPWIQRIRQQWADQLYVLDEKNREEMLAMLERKIKSRMK